MVSLIVPCYNGEEYISRCIDSILNQTYKDIELILVNDGSTDKTDEIIKDRTKELENQLTKFIYIVQENQGVGAACNTAFKYVTGEFLTLIDVDDIMLPESIEKRVSWLLENKDYGIVRTNGYYVNEDDVNNTSILLETGDYEKVNANLFEELFYGTTYVWPGTYMIRISVLDSIYKDREIYPSRSGQNLQFLWAASYASKCGFINEPLMKYVVRKESLSHFSSGDIIEKQIKAYKGYKDIRLYLIKNSLLGINTEEWEAKLEDMYAKIFLNLSYQYDNEILMIESYSKLIKPNLNEKIIYYFFTNKFMYLILKIYRRIKLFLGGN